MTEPWDGPRSYVWIDAVFRGAVLVDQLVADYERAGPKPAKLVVNLARCEEEVEQDLEERVFVVRATGGRGGRGRIRIGGRGMHARRSLTRGVLDRLRRCELFT
jgi:hypothetical protein